MVIKKRGNTDQLAKDWEEYTQDFKTFLHSTKMVGVHENPEIVSAPCRACTKLKELIKWIGGTEAKTMFDYVGEVEVMDNWQEALYKITRGILRYSFMQKMPDSRKHYTDWYNIYVGYKKNQMDQINQHITMKKDADTQTKNSEPQQETSLEDPEQANMMEYVLSPE